MTPRLWRIWLGVAGAACAYLAYRVAELCASKAYAIDEFHYVHRSWLATHDLRDAIVNGKQLVTTLWFTPFVAMGGDDPASMIYVRLSMLLVLGATVAAMAWIAARSGADDRPRWVAAVLAVLLALSARQFLWHAIEVRPDGVALMLVLASVAVLYARRLRDWLAAAAAGLLLFLACLASRKAIVYGAVFAPVFAVDLWCWLRGRRPAALRCPLSFAAGFAAGLVALVIALAALGGFDSFWHGFYTEARMHERHYPGFSAWRYVKPYVAEHALVWIPAAVGGAALVHRGIAAFRRDRVVDRGWLLVLLVAGGWVSHLLQTAAYPYSMLPGIAFTVLLAARGLDELAALAPRDRALVPVAAVLLAAPVVLAVQMRTGLTPRYANDRQIEVQRMIGRLTAPTDTVYDSSATYVYRPRGHDAIFIDASRAKRLRKQLEREIPEQLVARQTPLFVYDKRFHGNFRRGPIGQWVLSHYHPMNGDLYVWGRRYDGDRALTTEFHAIMDGDYFVYPPEAAARGALVIDGRELDDAVFTLARGPHQVTWRPDPTLTPRSLYLMWLPRDGKPFVPGNKKPDYELGRYILP